MVTLPWLGSVTRQAVSKHLRVLEEAGFVESRRVGRESRYAYCPETVDTRAPTWTAWPNNGTPHWIGCVLWSKRKQHVPPLSRVRSERKPYQARAQRNLPNKRNVRRRQWHQVEKAKFRRTVQCRLMPRSRPQRTRTFDPSATYFS
jgi:DNA-binding transcriptional ArsR family regulator